MLGAVLVEGKVDGIEDGWIDKLGSCDGREFGSELAPELGTALFDGSPEACKVG